MQTQYDIIIIGAGIVGLAFAASLKHTTLKIAIIDKCTAAPGFPTQDYAPRVSAITHAAQHFFQQIDVWSIISSRRFCAYTDMVVWDALGNAQIEFSAKEVARANLGYIIENDIIQTALFKSIESACNIDMMFSTKVDSCQDNIDFVSLMLSNGQVLTGKLVVGADGAQSWLRDAVKIPFVEKSYDHDAVICHVTTEKSHQHTAWQRFMTDGPLAFLPLSDRHTCSIVWSCVPEQATQLMQMEDAFFRKHLQQAIDDRLGEILSVTKRYQFPLKMRHAKQYVKPRVALIGDAVHTIHPLAGQGLNLGILDAKCLALQVKAALKKSRDIGAYDTLRRYARARKEKNKIMLLAMRGFREIFATKQPVFIQGRSFGLRTVSRFAPLKRRFIYHALGLDESCEQA